MSSVLTGNRSTVTRVDLLNDDESYAGRLDGVTGGSVVYTSAKSVHGSASLSVVDAGQVVDWLNCRLRPVITVAGVGETSLGVFLVSEAPEDWDDTGCVRSVGLLDKCTILDQDSIDAAYSLNSGTVVTDAIVTLIGTTGETNIAITPSAAVLANPLVWAAGATKLQIVNDLLSIINYFSLYCNGDGQYRGEPYTTPANRPTVWQFIDGDNCIYLPTLTKDVDLFAIPNKVIAITQGGGAAAALTSAATNDDPASPYSTVSRGRTITTVYSGVEAADQPTLDAYALRQLIALTTPTASIDIQHAYVPGLSFNQAVYFRRTPATIDGRHVIGKTETSLDPTALVKTTLTEVVDL